MNNKSIALGILIGAVITAVLMKMVGSVDAAEDMLSRCEKAGWIINITRSSSEMIVECNNLVGE